MDFYAGGSSSSSAFFQPELEISSPSIEVYVAGRCADTPVILTKMISVSPRRKSPRYSTLDAIPETCDILAGSPVSFSSYDFSHAEEQKVLYYSFDSSKA